MSEQHKALVRRFLEEVFNKGNVAVIDELIAEDYVDHSAPPGAPPGPAIAKHTYTMFRAAFPDLRVDIHDLIADGDQVVVRATWTGTHRGDLMGLAPSGKQVTIPAIGIVRIRDSKFVERWEQADMLGLLQQIGALAGPGA